MTALAAKVAPPTPAAFGLRPVPLRLAGVGVLAALGAVALAAVVAQVAGGAFDGLPVPPEVSEQGALGRLVGDPDPTVVDLGGGAVSSLLARAVVLPLFAELLLRGFCLPILARRFGDRAAVAGVAVATALLGAGAAGSGWLLLPGLVLGFALCLLYLETGSILPGTVVVGGLVGRRARHRLPLERRRRGVPGPQLRRPGRRRGARDRAPAGRRPAGRLSLVADCLPSRSRAT